MLLPRIVLGVRPRPFSIGGALAAAGLATLLAASTILAVDAAAAPSFLVPGGHREFPSWVAGPLAGLGERTTWTGLGILLVVMLGAWLVVLAWARRLSPRTIVAAIVAAHVIFLLAPPLLSADVFGYVGLARLGAVHHLNPYLVGTLAAHHDPILPFLRWHNAESPYGPLFTLLSYALVPLGVAGSVWAFKAIAFAASLGVVALVWRLAGSRGVDPRPAAVLVGLNPVVLAFEVGGGHNDAIVVLLTLAGVALVLRERPLAGTASVVGALAMKASAGVVAPFAVLGAHHRGRAVAGVAVALGAAVLLAVAMFGAAAGSTVSTLQTAGTGVASHSVPSEVARLLGAHGVGPAARLACAALAALAIGLALRWTWRGGDWVTAAAWATLALLLTTTWLVPWYATWLTPLAALSRDRRLHAATVAFVAYAVVTRVTFLLG